MVEFKSLASSSFFLGDGIRGTLGFRPDQQLPPRQSVSFVLDAHTDTKAADRRVDGSR